MASDDTREWVQFFRGCGIPDDIAARYGLVFNENRIQKNMLLDLNKEYLRDMGITVMGDIIAILRHAKVVHDKYIRDQILQDSKESLSGENLAINPNLKGKNSTPMKRMIQHYARKFDPSQCITPQDKAQVISGNDNSAVNIPRNFAHQAGVQMIGTMKQIVEAPAMRSDDLLPGNLEVPAPPFRRLFPEYEGSYTVKMPSGTTKRSKQLLEKLKSKQNKTVFDRLGESSVSSTSDVSTTSGTTTQTSKVPNSKEKNTLSVFSRLGEKTTPLVTSTSSSGTNVEMSDQLPYKGILKSSAAKKKVHFSPNSTMRADNELQSSKANNPKENKMSLVKERLGTGLKSNQSSRSDTSVRLNRFQITTTSEEKLVSLKERTLSKSLKSLKTGTEESVKEKQNVLDGLGRFRSESVPKRANVTSTNQLLNKQRGVKRRLQDTETLDGQVSDITQSKKVRFGRTTQRLIPGNAPNRNAARNVFPRPTVLTAEHEKSETKKLILKSGVEIGPMNSDKIKEKLSLKERIGLGSLSSKTGKIVRDLNRKRYSKFNSRFKKAPITVHDRLG